MDAEKRCDDCRRLPAHRKAVKGVSVVEGSALTPNELTKCARRTRVGRLLFAFLLGKLSEGFGLETTAPSFPLKRSRMFADHLARNLLEALPGELRRFLLSTCVLPRFSVAICDGELSGHWG